MGGGELEGAGSLSCFEPGGQISQTKQGEIGFMNRTDRQSEIKLETIHDLCAMGIISLRNLNTGDTIHLRQKQSPQCIFHEGVTYHYHGTQDGMAFYSTQTPQELAAQSRYWHRG